MMKLFFLVIIAIAPVEANSVQLGKDVFSLAQSSNAFGQDMYQLLVKNNPNQNVVFSPFSIHSAASMVSMGAAGNTLKEIANVMHFGALKGQAPYDAYKTLNSNYRSVDRVQLLVANGLWLNPKYPIYTSFKDAVADKFDSVIENIDFAAVGGPQVPINKWISQQTKDIFKDVLQARDIKKETMTVFVNTIFFNGTWALPFDKALTTPTPFTKTDGTQTKVNMMINMAYYRYKYDHTNKVEIAELPFNNSRFVLNIVLPRPNVSLANLETFVSTPNGTNELFDGLRSTKLQLYLPRFEIKYSIKKLKEDLIKLGMITSFTDLAQFPKVSKVPMKLNKAIHKANIKVIESGTTAAAVTVFTGVEITSVQVKRPVVFNANRPFMFFLRDKLTQDILFQGKLAAPKLF